MSLEILNQSNPEQQWALTFICYQGPMQREYVSHVSRDPMKPDHLTNQEKLLKINSL